jgi:hypothetical protein
VVRVEPYLRQRRSDRGAKDIDLVDFLDGYLVLMTFPPCAGLRAILAQHTFAYDFAGPVTCP